MIPKGVAYKCPLEMLTTGGAADSGATAPTVTVILDGSATGNPATNAPVQTTGTHAWYVLLTAAEMNADLVSVIATRAGDVPCVRHIVTESVYTAAKAGYLDASIDSRVASEDYTAPDNTTIGLIQAAVAGINTYITTTLGTPTPPDDITSILATITGLINDLPVSTEYEADISTILDALSSLTDELAEAQTKDLAAEQYASLAGLMATLQATAEALDPAHPSDVTSAQTALSNAITALDIPTATEIAAEVGAATPGDLDAAVGTITDAIPAAPDLSGLATADALDASQTAILEAMPSNDSIAARVWSYGSRTVTSWGTLIVDLVQMITTVFARPSTSPASYQSIRDRDNRTTLSRGTRRTIGDTLNVLSLLIEDIQGNASGRANDPNYEDRWFLKCLTSDLPVLPIPEQALTIDGRLFIVNTVQDIEGLLDMRLRVRRA